MATRCIAQSRKLAQQTFSFGTDCFLNFGVLKFCLILQQKSMRRKRKIELLAKSPDGTTDVFVAQVKLKDVVTKRISSEQRNRHRDPMNIIVARAISP
uniref:Uncharacterized protein n=1 Tax=Solanum lycopersicum TaxID=4081 RepID=A0A3Q7H0E3_SOLLC